MSRLPPAFGPFEPLRRLGAGGMAETFAAVRRGPGGFEQQVCIKRILPAHESDAEFVRAFLDEARMSASLRHANIVQVLDFGVADGSHYLALELIEGLDLRALMQRTGETLLLEPEVVTLIALDLALALSHAHVAEHGRTAVVHRDISPSNVLISRAGEVKLTDFGIARAMNHTHRTDAGVLKGKVPYMPPEYIEHGQFDPRGDLFSLGVMLYELLCGERPFDGHSDIDTVRRILAGQYQPLRERGVRVSEQLATCVERLLASDPEGRFESARALADSLPEVSTHRARKRLGELVNDRLAGNHAALTGHAPTLPSPGLAAAAMANSSRAAPPETRTAAVERTPVSAPFARALPSRRALSLLAGAFAIFSAVILFALLTERGPSVAVGAPPVPTTSVPPAPAVAAERSVSNPEPPPVEPRSAAQILTPEPEKVAAESPPVGEGPVATAVATAKSKDAPRLRVYVLPHGDVWIDGERVGASPINVRVSRGPHEVSVGDGRPELHRSVRIDTTDVSMTIRREGSNAP